jgi:hypothetical protein
MLTQNIKLGCNVAKQKKTKTGNKGSFKKGSVPPSALKYPKGTNHLSVEFRSLKAFNKEDLMIELASAFHRPRKENEAIVKDPEQPMLKAVLASIMQHSYETGDASRLDVLLDRAVGTVTQKIAVTTTDLDEYAKLQPDERRERIEKLRGILEWRKQKENELHDRLNAESVTINVTPQPIKTTDGESA